VFSSFTTSFLLKKLLRIDVADGAVGEEFTVISEFMFIVGLIKEISVFLKFLPTAFF